MLIETQVIDAVDVAQITGATPRSVSRWTAAKAAPRRDAEDRLLELKSVVDLLRSVLRDGPARLWLRSPNPDLDWRKPLELIADGEYRRVIGSVLAMAEGVTAEARGGRTEQGRGRSAPAVCRRWLAPSESAPRSAER